VLASLHGATTWAAGSSPGPAPVVWRARCYEFDFLNGGLQNMLFALDGPPRRKYKGS